ncbi:MAG: DUF11 domain-containing protein, partial [Planctomycetes bacterium]|nr:DUF11 domain-containing protein [Planctomycetota bacterium]
MSGNSKKVLAVIVFLATSAAITALAQSARTIPPKRERLVSRTDEPARSTVSASRSQSANVSIELIGPPSASAGVPADYELVVRNHGSQDIDNVRVEAELPEGTEFIAATPPAQIDTGTATWMLDRLEPGRDRHIKVQLRPVDEGTVECHALATCTALCATRTAVTKPLLTLTMSDPPDTPIGQLIPLTLTVSNPGSGPAMNVMVRDTVPDGLVHPAGHEIEYEIGTVGAGESRVVQLDLTARVAGALTNRAEVTGDGGLRATAETTLRVLEPKLALKKTGPKRRTPGRPATYSLVVSNPGTTTASNVAVVDELPEGLILVEASDTGQLSRDKRSVHWAIAQLDAGESRTLTVTLRPVVPGEFRTQAVATADGELRAADEACTTVEGISSLSLEVADVAGPIEKGAETTYEIRVVNRGSQAATNVVVRAAASNGLKPLKADGPVRYSVRGQEISFEPLTRLAARADAAYHIQVRGDQAGDLRLRVTLQ